MKNNLILKSTNELLTGRQLVINVFESGIFPMMDVDVNDDNNYDPFIYDDDLYPKKTLTPKTLTTPGTPGTPTTAALTLGPSPGRLTQGVGIKILSSKQILQRLLILLAQVHVGNTYENLLNKIRQIVY